MTTTTAESSSKARGIATALLIATTAVWGSTFVVVKDLVQDLPVADFLAVRFALAAAVLAILRPKSLRLTRQHLRWGVPLGVVLALGYLLQTQGLRTTSAWTAGFITGLFVVFTPLLSSALFKQRLPRGTWWGVALATAGLAALSLQGWSLGIGELLTLGCAFAYAVHIIGLGAWSTPSNAASLALVQLIVVSVLCGIASLPGGLTLPAGRDQWGAVIFLAVFATATAFLAQTWAQAHMSATRAAVVITFEPVFAAIFAFGFAGEQLTIRTVIGGALIVAAMYLVELGPRHSADGRIQRLEA
ncbi:MAG TPA: EamA family transporter [Actinobacteria bacterium]|nr:EamA family transporter [Actinomycetota bacterium]